MKTNLIFGALVLAVCGGLFLYVWRDFGGGDWTDEGLGILVAGSGDGLEISLLTGCFRKETQGTKTRYSYQPMEACMQSQTEQFWDAEQLDCAVDFEEGMLDCPNSIDIIVDGQNITN